MIQLSRPTQLLIDDGDKSNQKIKKIQASGYNSVAYSKEGRIWLWGGTSRGKLGLNSTHRDQLEPINVEFEVLSKEKNDGEEVTLEPFLD